MSIKILNTRVLVDGPECKAFGIGEDTFKGWRRDERSIGEWEEIDGVLYIYEDTIPTLSRKKLPSTKRWMVLYQSQKAVQSIYEEFQQAYAFGFSQYLPTYATISGIKPEAATAAAKFHAVYQCLFDRRIRDKVNDLANEYAAFNRLLPSVSGSKHDFSRKIKNCINEGVDKEAFDWRKLGNHNEDTTKVADAAVKKFIWTLTADPLKFSSTEILERLKEDCESRGATCPGVTRVRQIMKEALQDYHVRLSRYGEQQTQREMPYSTLIKPPYAHMLHMMDGWKIPAHYNANTGNKTKDGYQTLTMVYVMDVATKWVIGARVGTHETGEEIREALRSSVSRTGVVPYQMVMDKHTSTKTQEWRNLKKLYDKHGCTIIETINPQEKSDIERQHRILDKMFKKYVKGWHGGGIQASDKETRVKKEAVKRSKLTVDELITAAAAVLTDWNERPGADGLSPIQRVQKQPCPQPLRVDMYGQALLFIKQGNYTVDRNQVNIVRNGVKHEFLLPAVLWKDWNSKEILASWEDLTDCIYLFDPFTLNPLATVKPKDTIHADKASQTAEDEKKFGRHGGIVKGIISDSEKTWEMINSKAATIDEDIDSRIDVARTPKSVRAAMQGNPEIRQYAEMMGANTTTLYDKPQTPHTLPEIMSKRKKQNDKLFTPTNHTIREITSDEDLDSI